MFEPHHTIPSDPFRPTVTWIREDKEDIKMITNNGFAKGNYKVVGFLQIALGTVKATTFEDSGLVGTWNLGLVKTLGHIKVT